MRTRPSTISIERWKRIESLFEAAAEQPAGERDQFLAAACTTDAELRREVAALLDADQRSDGFIEPIHAGDRGVIDARGRDQLPAGSRIGAYEIVDLIATGGMGRVYLAARTDRQFEKRVAVKVIKRGMDTDEVVRRFRAERQTLANLEHPHIARLLDGGMTEDGLPYLVMDYIEGRSIDVHCDERRVSIRERLRLFRDVCAAVDYAHRNLVVHRDLKHANILVTPEGVPKLLDFGIAKVLDTAGTKGSSALTLEGFRPMTPEYASPEQVRGEPITTASDVYSLGVILYELLSGHRPYRFDAQTPAEVQRVICEHQPEPPSTAIGRTVPLPGRGLDSTRTLTPESVSHTRGAHPRRLRRLLSGDLDNIVLTALRKEPERRYGTVRQLADDIDRYLRGLPVTARRDSWGYRTGKWVRRQPAVAAMIALLALTLTAGVVGMTWMTREAIAQRDAAQRERDRADLEARKAGQINEFVQNMLASVHPEREGVDVTVREVLDEAASRMEAELAGQPLVEADVRSTLGQAYHGLGLYPTAEVHLRTSLALKREHGVSPTELALTQTHLGSLLAAKGDYQEAAALLEDSRNLLASSGEHDPLRDAEVLDAISSVRRDQGALAEAESQAREALELRRAALGNDHLDVAQSTSTLAALLQEKGDFPGADALYREAVELKRRRVGEDHPLLAVDFNNWAEVLRRLARFQEAEATARKAVDIRRAALGPDHPALATSLSALGLIVRDMERRDEAEALYREALEINRKALGPDHPDLGGVLNDLAGVLRQKKDYAGAEAMYREALRIVETKFGRKHPLVAIALHNLGRLFHAQDQFDEAEVYYSESADINREVLGADHPQLAMSLNNLGSLRLSRKDFAGAVPVLTEAVRIKRATLPPGHPGLALSIYGLARSLMNSGAELQAEPLFREAARIWTNAESPDPVGVARCNSELAECLVRMGRMGEAEPLLMDSLATLREKRGDKDEQTQRAAARLVAVYAATGRADLAGEYEALAGPIDAEKP